MCCSNCLSRYPLGFSRAQVVQPAERPRREKQERQAKRPPPTAGKNLLVRASISRCSKRDFVIKRSWISVQVEVDSSDVRGRRVVVRCVERGMYIYYTLTSAKYNRKNAVRLRIVGFACPKRNLATVELGEGGRCEVRGWRVEGAIDQPCYLKLSSTKCEEIRICFYEVLGRRPRVPFSRFVTATKTKHRVHKA